ncbi:hypothetical protein HID58_000920 [Brassica napus]|uniref:Uncharacterized protein n=1 Tax=Brassica napus TaxID=3708 RepID=A0ABQ8EIJ4_BRANA|nr:hypothetical protein HID58_000920 [Brassica napus]
MAEEEKRTTPEPTRPSPPEPPSKPEDPPPATFDPSRMAKQSPFLDTKATDDVRKETLRTSSKRAKKKR